MMVFWVILVAVVVIGIIILTLSFSGKHKKVVDTTYQDALKALLDGEEEEAIRRLRDTVTKDTDNVDAYVRLGRLIRERGDAQKAADIHQSLTVRPGLGREDEKVVYAELVADYLMLERFEKAVGLLKELVRVSAKEPSHLRRLLALLLERSRTEEAARMLKDYEKRIKDKKERAAWYAHVAGAWWEKGDEEKGAQAIKRASRLSKNHPYLLAVQAGHLAERGQKSKAKSVLDRFIKDNPRQVEMILDLLEQVYFDLGIYEKVPRVYNNLLRTYPQKREIRIRLAELKAKEGEPEQAAALINDALAESPADVGYLLEYIKLLLAQKKIDQVEQAFARLGHILESAPLICTQCGHELSFADWFCPGCGMRVRQV